MREKDDGRREGKGGSVHSKMGVEGKKWNYTVKHNLLNGGNDR